MSDRQGETLSRWLRAGLVLALLACPIAGLASAPSIAATPAAEDSLPWHPLELRALVDPESVLKALPAEIQRARAQHDSRTLSLLYLAQANACRVIADWNCQRDAGRQAAEAGHAARDPILVVRGLIAQSRGSIALQDFSNSEHLLGQAEVLLKTTPSPELSADVFLAYSSLGSALGKFVLAEDYANRGLRLLTGDNDLPMQVRLLRNRARAEAQLGNLAEARASLAAAQALAERFTDPKLRAELLLETARLARLAGDVVTEKNSGDEVLQLAEQLKNSQLSGLGHEVLGLAALDQGDLKTVESELRLSYESFRSLQQGRDELRVLSVLTEVEIRQGKPTAVVNPLALRFLELSAEIDKADKAKAKDDFDARQRYAEGEVELVRLKDEAMLAQERERSLAYSNRLGQTLVLVAIVGAGVLGVFYLLQRRSHQRQAAALVRQQESEQRYRMLAENSRDMVVRMRPDGHRLYVSPSSKELLDLAPEELTEARWDLVHPDDRAMLAKALAEIGDQPDQSATVAYRARRKDGRYIWIEALARFIRGTDGRGDEIVYSGRDITARKEAEQALAESQQRLRAVTDNIPAIIAHIDSNERYLFANAYIGQFVGVDPESVIGRTMREVRGDASYEQVKDHIAEVLQGKHVNFEGEGEANGKHFHYQSDYVPDFAADGRVQGFYALTFDITPLKNAERELERLARIDSLAGVANRRLFDERFDLALARSKRHHLPIGLLYLDIDHFKTINDSHGHGVGDAVIREFATRLNAVVRDVDLVARLGGDEFVILIDDADSPEIGERVAVKLIASMIEPMQVENLELRVTTSIGIAFHWSTPTADGLLASADKALYAAKQAGRNGYTLIVCD